MQGTCTNDVFISAFRVMAKSELWVIVIQPSETVPGCKRKLPSFTPSTHVSSSIPRSSRHNANQSLFPRRSSRQDVMKRLVLALLLFIFKHLAIAPALTPEADITLVNPSMFAREGYRRHNMMLSMCSHKPPVHES